MKYPFLWGPQFDLEALGCNNHNQFKPQKAQKGGMSAERTASKEDIRKPDQVLFRLAGDKIKLTGSSTSIPCRIHDCQEKTNNYFFFCLSFVVRCLVFQPSSTA